MQRPKAIFGDSRCSPATLIYLAPTTFGASTDEVGALVAGAACVVVGFLAFFFDFLVAGVALVEVFCMPAVASALVAIGAAAAGAGATAGGVAAGVVVCAAAVSDTANALAISALNNLVMGISSV
jgi:hypothetical protein